MFILGLFIFSGFGILGFFISKSVTTYKQYDRTVTVKGLSQKEQKADVAIWPIQFTIASNELNELYKKIENDTKQVMDFLEKSGIQKDAITLDPPMIVDKMANMYGADQQNMKFRFIASQGINIYTNDIDIVRTSASKLLDLGKKGVFFKSNNYETKIEYIFTKLNEIKPLMIEEATKNARIVALKFAKDSNSKLGKIKHAKQGQFVIYDRDKNTPYIKKIRIVSTIEYYLND